MLSVILLILKIIGIVLLCLLGLVLFLLLLVLLVPVRYRGKAAKQEAIEADVHATWLLHLVHVIVSYGEEGLQKRLKIFGIRVRSFEDEPAKAEKEESEENGKTEEKKETGGKDEKAEVKTETETGVKIEEHTEGKTEDKAGSEPETAENAGNDKNTEDSDNTENTETDTASVKDEKPDGHKVGKKAKKDRKKDKDGKRDKDRDPSGTVPEEKLSFFEKLEKKKTDIAEKLNNIYNKLVHYKEIIDDPRFKNGIRYALNRVFAALKHILPRKLKGWAHYGFEDPSMTGYITAAVGATYGMFHDFMKFEPDFENEVLEGNIEFRGHVRIGTVLFIALQVILKKDCRFVYKTIKAEGND